MTTSTLRTWWHDRKASHRRSGSNVLDRSAGSISAVIDAPWGPLY
jgi:hypothetical protein